MSTAQGVIATPAHHHAVPAYNEDVVCWFTIATIFWGVVAFLMGTLIAFQLAYPILNFGLEWTTFGRLRPVHTSAAVFAFGANALLGTSLYVVPRTCRAALFGSRVLATFLFWSYQLFIVLAAAANGHTWRLGERVFLRP